MRGNGGERFDAERMVCAGDVDGRAPLSSGCNGDSGGPLYAEGPVLLGIVSWGSEKCGADGTPSVFAQVDRYASFITDPDPVWAPQTTGLVTVKRSAGRLKCAAPAFAPARDEARLLVARRRPDDRVRPHVQDLTAPSAGDLPDRGEQRRRILDCALGTVLVRDRAQGEGAAAAAGLLGDLTSAAAQDLDDVG